MKNIITLTLMLCGVSLTSNAKEASRVKPLLERECIFSVQDYRSIPWEHCGFSTNIICETLDEYDEISDALWDSCCSVGS